MSDAYTDFYTFKDPYNIMNYSLSGETGHLKGYDLSCKDVFLSLITGLSGIPYAQRHWELSNLRHDSLKLGHRVIAVIQYIPLLGGLAAFIERVVVAAIHFFQELSHRFNPSNQSIITQQNSSEQTSNPPPIIDDTHETLERAESTINNIEKHLQEMKDQETPERKEESIARLQENIDALPENSLRRARMVRMRDRSIEKLNQSENFETDMAASKDIT